MRNDLRFSQNQRGINIAHFVPRKSNLLERFFQKDDRVCAFPFGITRRKVAANIACRDRSQQCVGNGVKKHVAIGMARQPPMKRYFNSANFQRNTCLELM